MIYQLKVLTLSFHLNQWGPLKAFGSPRSVYMAANWHTQPAACWAATFHFWLVYNLNLTATPFESIGLYGTDRCRRNIVVEPMV
jgi:hypothetical protein